MQLRNQAARARTRCGISHRVTAALTAAGVVVALSGASAMTASYGATTPDALSAGQWLSAGQSLVSSSGNMRLAMQTDGNLVLYTAAGVAVWASHTYGSGSTDKVSMQTDGNLAIYTATGAAVWSTSTTGTGSNNRLDLQTDGNLVLYTSANVVLWSSKTWGDEASTPSPLPTPTPVAGSPANPLAGDSFYVMPDNPAAQAAAANPSQASELNKIADQPTADWITPRSPDSLNQSSVASVETTATEAGKVPIFVLYAIPERDCGSYSSGGEPNDAAYEKLVDDVEAGIAGRPAVVIVEPDSMTDIACLNTAGLADRLALLKFASDTLSVARTSVYLDAGNATEHGSLAASQAAIMPLLVEAGISVDAGFELDTSLDELTSIEQTFGDQMSASLAAEGIGGKGYTVDTSRNGNGPAANPLSAWCNLPGLGLGSAPSASTSDPLNDAYLWVKYPGQSDGSCQGAGVSDPSAPASGVFWPAYAIGLAEGNSP
jgi:endoglucanase